MTPVATRSGPRQGRARAMPRWVSYLGYACALVLLVTAGEHQWTQLVFPTWALHVSVVILVTPPPTPAGRTAE